MATQDANVTAPTFPGPELQGRKTNITNLNHDQLSKSSLLPAIISMINDAYRTVAKRSNILHTTDRFPNEGDFPGQFDPAADSFTFVVTWADDPSAVVGTVGARRYVLPTERREVKPGDAATDENSEVFGRTRVPARRLPDNLADREMWELNVMAVHSDLHRQGLAGYLLRLTEDEVRRQSRDARERQSPASERSVELVMVLTTTKNNNGAFYEKRGYGLDYQRWNPLGTMDSVVEFTVGHYSKLL